MHSYSIKIGVAPIRRNLGKRTGIFNPEYAVKNKVETISFIEKHYSGKDVEFINLDFLNDEGMLFDEKDSDKAAQYFLEQKVDALFIINCNFGNEEASGSLAQKVQKPVLIWAPQDTIFEEDGTRYTDAQCGSFALSKYLQRYSIPFSHIENCRITDPVFDKDFKKFLSVASMVKTFTGLRILQVGTRPKPFCSVIVNEGELIEKFDINVVPVNLAVFTLRHKEILERRKTEIDKAVVSLKSRYDVGSLTDETLQKMMAFKFLYPELLEEYNCDIVSTECWTGMMQAVDAMPCTAMSELADEGIIVTCESDIHGAITTALLAAASFGKQVPMFIEFTTRHPDNSNAEMLWHCGPVAYSLKEPSSKAKILVQKCSFEIKHSNYTIARMDMVGGKYSLLAGTFKSVDGPYTFGNYAWAEFDNLPKWEKKIINGPYIHHMAEIEGDYVDVLTEFCNFIPNLSIDLT